MSILSVRNITYAYKDGDNKRVILENVSVDFEEGKFYSILGVSGSGKTTFLSLLSALDYSQCGEIRFKDKNIQDIGVENYRKNEVGIIFQNYQLIPYLSAYQNVLVAMEISEKTNKKDMKEESYRYLEKVGINKETAHRKVTQLSGGEQQRVAIARALSKKISIIFADEPTGNLDLSTSKIILDIFKKLAHEEKKCVIVVTHSKEIANESDVLLRLDMETKNFVIEKK